MLMCRVFDSLHLGSTSYDNLISRLTNIWFEYEFKCSEANEKAADNVSDKLQSVGISSGGADGAQSSAQTGM